MRNLQKDCSEIKEKNRFVIVNLENVYCLES